MLVRIVGKASVSKTLVMKMPKRVAEEIDLPEGGGDVLFVKDKNGRIQVLPGDKPVEIKA